MAFCVAPPFAFGFAREPLSAPLITAQGGSLLAAVSAFVAPAWVFPPFTASNLLFFFLSEKYTENFLLLFFLDVQHD